MTNIAVLGDTNSHVGGPLRPMLSTVFIGNLAISTVGDAAGADSKCDGGNPHCSPIPVLGSPNVFVENKPVHRVGDPRSCGAVTIVGLNLTVKAN